MEAKRTIVIGDVHGCYNELIKLLADVRWCSKTDRVILAGDLVDRGPHSADVVTLSKICKFELVLGNHDEKHIRYRKHLKLKENDPSYKIPIKMYGEKLSVHQTLTDEHIAILSTAVPFIRLQNDFIVVHGGLFNKYPELQDPDKICRLRYLDKTTGKSVKLIENFQQPPNSVFWSELWEGPETVVYGHNVHWLDGKPYFTVREGKIKSIGIDTGACFGGHLTAFVLEPDGRWWYKSIQSDVNVSLEAWGK